MFIKNALSDIEFLGSMSFSNEIMESDIKGIPSYEASQQVVNEAMEVKKALERFI
jgi:CO dehydrogenase nickel-insertion accessory protein CooC1